MADLAKNKIQKITSGDIFDEIQPHWAPNGKEIIFLSNRSKDPDFNPVKHTFCKHQYVREIFNPAGEMLITKIHKVEHPFFLLKGEMSILSEEGEMRISAPYYGVTPVGTKRVILAHTDCTFVTVHPTEKTDLKEIEDELIAKDYKELEVA